MRAGERFPLSQSGRVYGSGLNAPVVQALTASYGAADT